MLSSDSAAVPVQFLALRITVALAYTLISLACWEIWLLWVLGNCAQRAPGPPDTFVFSLALADAGLALTLPFLGN